MITLGPSLALSFSVAHGWRTALQIPALLAIVLSACIPLITVDKPSDVGYEDQTTLGSMYVIVMSSVNILNCFKIDSLLCDLIVKPIKP